MRETWGKGGKTESPSQVDSGRLVSTGSVHFLISRSTNSCRFGRCRMGIMKTGWIGNVGKVKLHSEWDKLCSSAPTDGALSWKEKSRAFRWGEERKKQQCVKAEQEKWVEVWRKKCEKPKGKGRRDEVRRETESHSYVDSGNHKCTYSMHYFSDPGPPNLDFSEDLNGP